MRNFFKLLFKKNLSTIFFHIKIGVIDFWAVQTSKNTPWHTCLEFDGQLVDLGFGVYPWLFSSIRDLFPRFYAVGFHCCDHAGRITSWGTFMVHPYDKKRYSDINAAGDGTTWHEIGLISFIKARLTKEISNA